MSFDHARANGTGADRATRPRLFYGWRIVAACLASGTVANALGLYGAGVYLHTVTTVMGWSIGIRLVRGRITGRAVNASDGNATAKRLEVHHVT